MIHTDGRPTIANYRGDIPAAPVVSTSVEATYLLTQTPLLERDYAGTLVQLHYWGGDTILLVQDGDGLHSTTVARDRARDAFDHPYVYLP